MRTSEVPTHEPARLGGESKLNPITDGLAILRIILSEASPRKGVKLGAPVAPAVMHASINGEFGHAGHQPHAHAKATVGL
jgi:hypothetical protein